MMRACTVRKKLIVVSVAILAMLLGVAPTAMAQTFATGSISGTVKDPKGLVVPGATVMVRNVDTGLERTITTNNDGIYAAPYLEPGHYEVRANKEGLAEVIHKDILLEVGQALTIDFDMPLKTGATVVTVTTEVGLVETQKFDVGQTVSQTYVENLPLNGRRWNNFVLLTPGATEDGGFGGVSFRGISSLYNNNTVDGADNNQAFFSEGRGRTRLPYNYSLDAIKEFNVSTAAYTAEYGRAAGGVVNAVTRSGTSEIHGDFFYFIRDEIFLARDPFANGQGRPKPAERRQQFGGGLGGPLVKDKLFYFLDYDQQKHNFPAVIVPFFSNFFTDGQVTNCTDPNCPAVIAALKTITNTTDPRNGNNYIGLAKIDYQLSTNHHLSTALNILRWDSPNGILASPVLTTTALGNGTDNVNNEFSVTTWNWVINSKTVNEARFQYGRDFEFETANASGPSFTISGSAGFGMPNFLPRAMYPDEKRFQWVDNLSRVQGRHQFKAGVDINHVREQLINIFQGGGVYSYFGGFALNNFAKDLRTGSKSYTSFVQAVDPIHGSGGGFFTTTDYNFYVQDNFQVRSNLTLNLGVRYELQTMPNVQGANPLVPGTAKINTDTNNFGPRVGFSWGIGGQQKQVLRGGYGIYYGRTSNSTLFAALFQNGVFQKSFRFGTSSCGAPAAPNIVFPQPPGAPKFSPVFGTTGPTPTNNFASFAAFAAACPNSGASATVTVLDPHFVNPLVHEFDLAYERELPGSMSFTVSYIGARGLRLPTFVDGNLPRPDIMATYQFTDFSGKTSLQTLPFFSGAVPRPNPNVGVILFGESVINSWYNGLVIRLRRRTVHGFSFDSNFTWSQARDNGEVPGSSGTFAGTTEPLNPFNLKAENGLSDLDIRRRFIFTAYWEMPFGNWTENSTLKHIIGGWVLSSVWRVQDGHPVTALMSSTPFCPNISGTFDGGLTCGLVSSFGGSDNGRVPFITRNSRYTFPYLFTTDLRIGRVFKLTERASLEVLWEAFNLFNKTNVFGVQDTAFNFTKPTTPPNLTCPTPAGAMNFKGCITPNSGPGNFLSTTATSNDLYGARQMQIGAKFRF